MESSMHDIQDSNQPPKGLTEIDWDGIIPDMEVEREHFFLLQNGTVGYEAHILWAIWVDPEMQSAEQGWRLTVRLENDYVDVLLNNDGPFESVEDALYRAVDFIGNM